MRRLIMATIFLVFVPEVGRALLCARRNGTVASRTACKRHEKVVSLAELLPPSVPRTGFLTTRAGPVALPNPGADFGVFITPLAILSLPAGSYTVLATAFLLNHRSLADGVDCALTYQSPTTGLAMGVPFASAAVSIEGTATINVVGAWTVRDPSHVIRLWCTAGSPVSSITAQAVSLVAVPLDGVEAQPGCPSAPCPR
jgi:hypothetical protein